jgi:rare lipoprotein A
MRDARFEGHALYGSGPERGVWDGRVSIVVRTATVGGCVFCWANVARTLRASQPKKGVPSSPRLVALGQPVPKGEGTYRVGKLYVVGGRT